MILDDMKNLIKDFEKTLIKDTRFKKDYKFKNQVKTLYKNHKMVQQSQIIVPVPYYSGSLKTEVGAETKSDAQSTSNKKCPPEKTCPPEKKCPPEKPCPPEKSCPVYEKGHIQPFNKEEDELKHTIEELEELTKPYTQKEISEMENLSPEELEKKRLEREKRVLHLKSIKKRLQGN